jgi:hypothetical protein
MQHFPVPSTLLSSATGHVGTAPTFEPALSKRSASKGLSGRAQLDNHTVDENPVILSEAQANASASRRTLRFKTGHVGTAALGCPVERSSTTTLSTKTLSS